MDTRRIHFIDWLRVLAVLLLFPFHTSRVFNASEAFYVKGAQLSHALNYGIGFVGRWHMPLLFLLAGCSTYFAMRKRSGAQYAGERVKRLLLPFVFGFFVLVPPQTWLGGRFNSGYQRSLVEYLTSGDFLVFNVRDGGDYYGGLGFAHLWFIIFLFLISLVALPLLLRMKGRAAEKTARLARLLSRPHGALLATFLLFVGEALPEVVGIPLFYYLVFFVLGYVVMTAPEFMAAAERQRVPYLVFGVALTVATVAAWPLRESLADPSVPLAAFAYLEVLSAWCTIVGLLGAGRRYLDRPSPALSYLAEGSYPIYMLHQTAIVLLAWYAVRMDNGWPAQWIALLASSVVATFALYEVVRRVPAFRPLFGMKPKRA